MSKLKVTISYYAVATCIKHLKLLLRETLRWLDELEKVLDKPIKEGEYEDV